MLNLKLFINLAELRADFLNKEKGERPREKRLRETLLN